MNLLAGINLANIDIGSFFDPTHLPKYHWIKDPKYDAHAALTPFKLSNISLPVKVDLRPGMPPIVDQGNLGSCTGNCVAGVVEYASIKEGKATVQNPILISRLFIYYQERVLEGSVRYDAGAYIRDGIKAMYTYGAPLETLWPYNINKFAVKPPPAAYSDALNRRVSGVTTNTTLTATSINTQITITGVISSGNWVTVNSTANLSVGNSIVISGTTIRNLVAGTYYIKSIGTNANANRITLSTANGGSVFAVGANATGSMTGVVNNGLININSTTGIGIGTQLVFSGTGIGSYLTAGTYFVKSLGTNAVTVSSTLNGSVFDVGNGRFTGSMSIEVIPGYQAVPNFAACKQALAHGFPVVFGFTVYDSFESNAVAATGMMPYPNTITEQVLGGHCVCLVGYDDTPGSPTNGYFICRNSWGTDWGDHGYFYMPYQVIQNTNMSSDFWIITTVNNP